MLGAEVPLPTARIVLELGSQYLTEQGARVREVQKALPGVGFRRIRDLCAALMCEGNVNHFTMTSGISALLSVGQWRPGLGVFW